jgi:hypothetical protein
MTGDLKEKTPVPSFIKQLVRGKSANGQSAEDEWPGTETEILCSLVAFDSNYFNAVSAL